MKIKSYFNIFKTVHYFYQYLCVGHSNDLNLRLLSVVISYFICSEFVALLWESKAIQAFISYFATSGKK